MENEIYMYSTIIEILIAMKAYKSREVNDLMRILAVQVIRYDGVADTVIAALTDAIKHQYLADPSHDSAAELLAQLLTGQGL